MTRFRFWVALTFLVVAFLYGEHLPLGGRTLLSEISSGAVLVTGAGKGLGKAMAIHLAARGFRVYAGVRNETQAKALHNYGPQLIPISLDIDDPVTVEATLQRIQKECASTFVGLVNNAAILKGAPFEGLDSVIMQKIFNTNLVSTALLTQKFLPLIRKNKGRIVMISSLTEELPTPFLGAYPATKTGLSGLSDMLRRELAPFGVFVANVEPGFVETDMATSISSESGAWLGVVPKEKRTEVKKVYGAYFSPVHVEYLKQLVYSMPGSADEVAQAVYHAITSRTPYSEYLLSHHGIVLRVMRVLPDWLVDWYLWLLVWPGPLDPVFFQ